MFLKGVLNPNSFTFLLFLPLLLLSASLSSSFSLASLSIFFLASLGTYVTSFPPPPPLFPPAPLPRSALLTPPTTPLVGPSSAPLRSRSSRDSDFSSLLRRAEREAEREASVSPRPAANAASSPSRPRPRDTVRPTPTSRRSSSSSSSSASYMTFFLFRRLDSSADFLSLLLFFAGLWGFFLSAALTSSYASPLTLPPLIPSSSLSLSVSSSAPPPSEP
mmetsp:Transcript_50321/g.151535  ORF Transcript_50321/g.151535 Transcript_50321/m.151535 type:complete len:219 (-) Transcript_50321:1513-2169(-)